MSDTSAAKADTRPNDNTAGTASSLVGSGVAGTANPSTKTGHSPSADPTTGGAAGTKPLLHVVGFHMSDVHRPIFLDGQWRIKFPQWRTTSGYAATANATEEETRALSDYGDLASQALSSSLGDKPVPKGLSGPESLPDPRPTCDEYVKSLSEKMTAVTADSFAQTDEKVRLRVKTILRRTLEEVKGGHPMADEIESRVVGVGDFVDAFPEWHGRIHEMGQASAKELVGTAISIAEHDTILHVNGFMSKVRPNPVGEESFIETLEPLSYIKGIPAARDSNADFQQKVDAYKEAHEIERQKRQRRKDSSKGGVSNRFLLTASSNLEDYHMAILEAKKEAREEAEELKASLDGAPYCPGFQHRFIDHDTASKIVPELAELHPAAGTSRQKLEHDLAQLLRSRASNVHQTEAASTGTGGTSEGGSLDLGGLGQASPSVSDAETEVPNKVQ